MWACTTSRLSSGEYPIFKSTVSVDFRSKLSVCFASKPFLIIEPSETLLSGRVVLSLINQHTGSISKNRFNKKCSTVLNGCNVLYVTNRVWKLRVSLIRLVLWRLKGTTIRLKGTVARYFWPLVFFMNRPHMGP